MKQILLFVCLTTYITSNSQKIEGFGEIKIGKSYQQTISDIQIKESDIKDVNKGNYSLLDIYDNKTDVFKFEYDTSININEDLEFYYTKCQNAIALKIPTYKVAGIDVDDITLIFYENKLLSIEILIPSQDFLNAFEAKYGKGTLTTEKKKVTCQSGITGNYDVYEYSYTTTYKSGTDNIEITKYTSEYRDSKCKKQFASNFIFSDKIKYKRIRDCEKNTVKKQEKKKKVELKKKLGNF